MNRLPPGTFLPPDSPLPHPDVTVVGIPFDLGAPRRGSGLAPQAIREMGLKARLEQLGLNVHDVGDLPVPDVERESGEHLRHHTEVHAAALTVFDAAIEVFEAARDAEAEGGVGLFIGGDHSIAIGTIAGVSSAFRAQGKRIGVIWCDAHGDFNTASTSLTGNLHGMPFAVNLGYGTTELTEIGGFSPKVLAEHCVLIGARDLDPEERQLIESAGVHCYTIEDLDERGIEAVMTEAIAIASNGTAGIHFSFDLDALDPKLAPGTGCPVPGGLTMEEAQQAFRMLGASGTLCSMDIVELDPLLDVEHKTARIAVELAAAAFGG